jgi:hypothetical protein
LVRTSYNVRTVIFGDYIEFALVLHKYTDLPTHIREYYQEIGHGWAMNNHTSYAYVVSSLDLPGCYDYALPQSFFDQYMRETGHAPHGVWYYPPRGEPNHLFGEFLAIDTCLDRLAEKADAALAAAELQTV